MNRHIKLFLSFFLCFVLLNPFCGFEVSIMETSVGNTLLASNTNTRFVKNLAIFIRFRDSEMHVDHPLDSEQSVRNAYQIFNSNSLFEMDSVHGKINVPSFKKYYERESYGSLSITTEILPQENGKVIAYTDQHPIGYYLKYNVQNPIGYKDQAEALKRETELINRAVAHVSSTIDAVGISASELDTDFDNQIDAVSFIIEGQKDLPSNIGWGDLLWSHKSDNQNVSETILGKKVVAYTLLYADDYTESAGLFSLNRGTYGTIIHEFGHVLGYMDLYRHGDMESKPVGFYDIMGNAIGSNPQSFLTYYISEYNAKTNWHSPLPVIQQTTDNITVYKPNFIDKREQRAVKIQVGANQKEYFIVEYHDKLNTYESYSADESGIVIYRVNEANKYAGNVNGGLYGERDHVYVFRPNETGLGAGKGNLSQATLNMNRRTFGKTTAGTGQFDNETIFFADGSNSRMKIEVTGQTSNSVTFRVVLPEMVGNGTKTDPYLIGDVDTFLYLLRLDTKNKYYKLTNDLDFQNITSYPSLNFEGNLDGNNKTIRNIKTNGFGVFNSIGHYQTHTKIENLKVESLAVYSKSGNYLGGFANSAENVTLQNVQLKSGTVTNEGNSLNDVVSTGGFLGNVNHTTIIENCFSNLNVTAPKNVGGFIGINMNAKIKDSFSTGIVTGTKNVGGFIGLQAISDNFYQIPENVYYDASKNENLLGAGGYAGAFHHLPVLGEADLSKGIKSVSIPTEQFLLKGSQLRLPITITPNQTITSTVTVEKEAIIKYDNQQLIGLEVGTSNVYVDILVGYNQMRLTCKMTVKNPSDSLTEMEVLDFLGLKKQDNYVIGFTLGTDVKTIRQKIAHLNVILKSFTNAKNVEIEDGIIATGMKFTLYFNNTEYHYTVVIKGDVNGDGLIYATDYVKVKNHIMGKSLLTGPYLKAADVNQDQKVYATDYVLIKNHIMGKNLIKQ